MFSQTNCSVMILLSDSAHCNTDKTEAPTHDGLSGNNEVFTDFELNGISRCSFITLSTAQSYFLTNLNNTNDRSLSLFSYAIVHLHYTFLAFNRSTLQKVNNGGLLCSYSAQPSTLQS